MLTEEQVRDVKQFTGNRFQVRQVIQTLRLCDPKDPEYPIVENEVARIINRNREIAIRVTDNELEELKTRAEKTGRSRMADYIRSAALGAEITTPPPVTIVQGGNASLDIKAAVRALQATAKNINQLVLNLNVHNKHHIIDPETADQYRREIERLLDALKQIEVSHG